MKFYTTVLLFFACTLFCQAKANVIDLTDSVADLQIENQQIICQQKVLGLVRKVKVQRNTSKSDNYIYQIFEKKGKLIAEYEMEISKKENRAQEAILYAQIKTLKDNVVHNGNNFLDINVKASKSDEENLLQLDKVVKYLLAYKYL